jgi:hypothetical protein
VLASLQILRPQSSSDKMKLYVDTSYFLQKCGSALMVSVPYYYQRMEEEVQ